MSENRGNPGRKSRNVAARLQLVLAAERYFTIRGFDGTSLKDIQEAAGQRNASAVHYHFGSRDQLIAAILDYRITAYAQKRLARMEALEGVDGKLTIRDVVSAWVIPLADELRPRPDGNFYIRFLDQLRRNGPAPLRARAADLQIVGYDRIFELLITLMPAGSERLKVSRLALTGELIISGLAQLEASMPAEGASAQDFPGLAVANLIDFASAGLAVEPDAETLALEQSWTGKTDFHFSFRGAI